MNRLGVWSTDAATRRARSTCGLVAACHRRSQLQSVHKPTSMPSPRVQVETASIVRTGARGARTPAEPHRRTAARGGSRCTWARRDDLRAGAPTSPPSITADRLALGHADAPRRSTNTARRPEDATLRERGKAAPVRIAPRCTVAYGGTAVHLRAAGGYKPPRPRAQGRELQARTQLRETQPRPLLEDRERPPARLRRGGPQLATTPRSLPRRRHPSARTNERGACSLRGVWAAAVAPRAQAPRSLCYQRKRTSAGHGGPRIPRPCALVAHDGTWVSPGNDYEGRGTRAEGEEAGAPRRTRMWIRASMPVELREVPAHRRGTSTRGASACAPTLMRSTAAAWDHACVYADACMPWGRAGLSSRCACGA
ncbi:hypothetical protein FB451DRAFT_1170508 [Mycena latifolia]|nr:hypothetical protein FB451DRAFT_1170508 [Mycena latifolia]